MKHLLIALVVVFSAHAAHAIPLIKGISGELVPSLPKKPSELVPNYNGKKLPAKPIKPGTLPVAIAPKKPVLPPKAKKDLERLVSVPKSFDVNKHLLAAGTEARVFAKDDKLVYRVPREGSDSPDLVKKIETMKQILGDRMPEYHGREKVTIHYGDSVGENLNADVFSRIGPEFKLPAVAFDEMSQELRAKVAIQLEAIRDSFEAKGYYPGDFGYQNYLVDPRTVKVMVINDPGILIKREGLSPIHQEQFEESLALWKN